jgi:endoglucanase
MTGLQRQMIVFTCFLVPFCLPGILMSASPVEQHGTLTVKEGKLLDKNGEVVALRGMSLFWSQWMPQYYNEKTIRWLADDWNVSVLRAAMAVERDGYLQNPEQEKAKIFAVIDACIAANIYVIVDWHDHKAVDHEAESVAFFKEVAAKYGQYPNLIYETYNEPLNSHSWEQIKKYHTAVVKAIRSVDSDNLILLGSSSWDQAVDEASLSPLEGFGNLAYTFHFYASDPNHQERLRSRADTAIKNGLCIFLSEWGVSESSGNGAFDIPKTTAWLQWMEENKLSWCVWSVADKVETSAALLPGASGEGGWKENDLTPGGKFIRNHIRSLNATGAFPAPTRALRLDNTETNDADLEKIVRDNPELVELTLGGTKITDAGLAHLIQLKKLRKIRISKTAVTDAGMTDLAKCEYLEDVDVSQTKIGDFGVWELRALPRVKNLNLYLTLVTDAGLDSFRRGEHRSAAKIERLNLDKCPITDAGIPKLASLTKLAWIHLGGTAMTDAGLAELKKLEPIKEAIVTKTETTQEGIEKLRRDRPDMTVRDNVSEKTPQEDIDEAAEYRKQLAPVREGGRL